MATDARTEPGRGSRIALRPAGPDDAPAIARLFAGLSADSTRRRFQAGQPAPGQIAEAARTDAPGTFCLLAADQEHPGRLIGEARYVPIEDDVAELAITIADAHQGNGLGGIMLAALIEHARTTGISYLRAVVLTSNAPMLRLLARYGCAQVVVADEMSVVTVDIGADGQMPGWPRAARGRRVLVEQRSWFADDRIEALWASGADVRRCQGANRRAGRSCPLLTSGRCRLAEQAEEIICLLPEADPESGAVAAAHRARWPERLAR